MSLFTEYIIPGDSGKVFTTNASKTSDLKQIQQAVLQVEGVEDVSIVKNVFPVEFIIHTNKLVRIAEVESAVKPARFHLIPKGLFAWESQEPK